MLINKIILYCYHGFQTTPYGMHENYDTSSHINLNRTQPNNEYAYYTRYQYKAIHDTVRKDFENKNKHINPKYIFLCCISILTVLLCSCLDYKKQDTMSVIVTLMFAVLNYLIINPIDCNSYFSTITMVFVIFVLILLRKHLSVVIREKYINNLVVHFDNLKLLPFIAINILIVCFLLFISIVLYTVNYVIIFIYILNILFLIIQVFIVLIIICTKTNEYNNQPTISIPQDKLFHFLEWIKKIQQFYSLIK